MEVSRVFREKKMHEHKNSDSHNACRKAMSDATADKLSEVLQQANATEVNNTCKIFNTCYYLLQKERPFFDLPALVDSQRANGLDMGVLLHSRVTTEKIGHSVP